LRYYMESGLAHLSSYKGKRTPIYFTENFKVIEAPTLWGMAIAASISSTETIRKYSSQIARFLHWLYDEYYDEAATEAIANDPTLYQRVDKDILLAYRDYLQDSVGLRDETVEPQTINDTMERVIAFYRWARDRGYPHYVDLSETYKIVTVRHEALLGSISHFVHSNEFALPTNRQNVIDHELDKLIDNATFATACRLLREDDVVYEHMARVMRHTALRPIDLRQLPFRGPSKGANCGFRPYSDKELAALWDPKNEYFRSILFRFTSKRGKRRIIPFPGDVWADLCDEWMPERTKRAKLFREQRGYFPNEHLFLSRDGDPVTYKMLITHFAKVARHSDYPRERFTPYMLRHAWATYTVLYFAERRGWLGKIDHHDIRLEHLLKLFMGHEDLGTTYKYYVHLAYLFNEGGVTGDLIYDLLRDGRDEVRALVRRSATRLAA